MRFLTFFLLFITSSPLFAQLGFCEGSKGDPIFHETFGTGSTNGPPLPASLTSYTYVNYDPQDGQYTISDRIGEEIEGWHSFLPNTTESNGKALIVNADYTSGQFYRTEITGLCQNTSYEFSAYLLNIYDRDMNNCANGGIPVNVRFEIWDETDTELLKSGSTGNIPSTSSPQWEQFALTFRSGAGQGSIILKMFNNGQGGCGNDVAIDDIIFRSCGDLTMVTQQGNSSSRLDVCEEETPIDVTLEATPDYTVYSTHFFQWQESADNENWQNIPGATAETYTASSASTSSYYRVKVAEDAANLSSNLCSSASEIFFLNILQTPDAPISEGDREICSDQPFPELSVDVANDESVNWYDAPAGGNLLAANTRTYIPDGAGTFFAEAIKTEYECEPGNRTAVTLTVYEAPTANDERMYLCDEGVLTLDAGPANMIYDWSTGETSRSIEVDEPGTYTVEITTADGCSTTRTIEVINVEVPVIRDIISEERRVAIVLEEEGDFEFSLDGTNYRQSNIFEDVNGGVYTVFVRDTSGCNVVTEEFAHIVIPKYITPNNDGRNDYFEIRGISFFASSEIRIFDRYGKLLKAGPGQNFRWDGTFSGNNLPADDYWYEIFIEGFESKRGHFSLVR